MGILDDLSQATCRTCHWWRSASPNVPGECHQTSPGGLLCPDTGIYVGVWPRTDAEDTCGDHQFRGAEP